MEAGRADAVSPHLIGRFVALRPVNVSDYDTIYAAEHSEELGPRWRLGGNTLRPERFADSLWQGVTAQFVITEMNSPQAIGLATLYDVAHSDQTAYFMVADFRNGAGHARVAQGAVLFLAYVFQTWSFRKIYMRAMEYNISQYKSLCGRLLKEEGRLRSHHYYAGQYWDEVIFALYREEWEKWEAKVLPGLTPVGK